MFSCDTLYWRVLDIKYSRRASLAVALLQEPELLILDEPTVRSNMIKMSHFHSMDILQVGVDPLLRQTIWRHLTKISRTTTTTIIITTHYVEEARQAHRVYKVTQNKSISRDYHQMFDKTRFTYFLAPSMISAWDIFRLG